MRKLLLGLTFLGGISFSQGVSIGSQNFQIFQGISWNTNEWAKWFSNSFEKNLLKIGNISTPIGNIPLGEFLTNIWQGISCKLPSFQGNINGIDTNIPTRISIQLPCREVYLDFSKDFQNLINQTTNKINGYVPNWFGKCLNNPTSPECVKTAVLKAYYQFDNSQIEAQSFKKYANMTNKEINQEIEKDSKNLAEDIFPTITKDGKTAYNNQILKADLGTMKEAGSSTGKFVYPDKKQVQGLPQNLKTAYGYAVGKQVVREKVIQMFQRRIDALFQELMAFKNVMDSYCKSDIPSTQVIPPSIGGVGGIANIEKLKKVAINRGCCCCDAIPTIHSAEHNVINRISVAESNIVKAIKEASLEIRTTIAKEEYNTRVQIHNEFMNYQANEKTYRCIRIKLEYLKLKIRLYDMMLKLAELETHYANLNGKEKKYFQDKIDNYLRKIR